VTGTVLLHRHPVVPGLLSVEQALDLKDSDYVGTLALDLFNMEARERTGLDTAQLVFMRMPGRRDPIPWRAAAFFLTEQGKLYRRLYFLSRRRGAWSVTPLGGSRRPWPPSSPRASA